VNALALDVSRNHLYLGGDFTLASNNIIPTSYIGSYNNVNNSIESFSSNGYGYTNGSVFVSVRDYSNNCIYVGGSFTTVYDSSNIAGLSANRIAKWDISKNVWNSLGTAVYNGINNTVNALALDVSRNHLYVGGSFTTLNDYVSSSAAFSANRVVRWDASNNGAWNRLGTVAYNGTNNTVNALALDVSRNHLYVGGSFTTVNDYVSSSGAFSANRVVRWDASNNGAWNRLGTVAYNGTGGTVNALALDVSRNHLYIGGTFTTVNDYVISSAAFSANRIVRFLTL
jgi:hypothetical protein